MGVKKKALIVGGGIAGSVCAIELAKKNSWDITIVDKRPKIGSGLRTSYIGGHPHTFGPRHFLTHNEDVYAYFNEIVPMRRCQEHIFYSYVEQDSNFYNYPIHYDDLDRMPEKNQIKGELDSLEASYREHQYKLNIGTNSPDIGAKNYREFWLKSIGPTLYSKFIETYTRKMWRTEDESKIDDFTWSPKGVAIKKGGRAGWDSAISAYPANINGYDPLFEAAERSANRIITVEKVEIDPGSTMVRIDGEQQYFDVILNSAPLDDLFGNVYGRLAYVGRTLQYLVLPVEFALPEDVYFCYYTGNEAYTRVTEYKKFTQYKSASTLISLEFPSNEGRYYPMPIETERQKYRLYEALQSENMKSLGRIGRFNYRFDIDDAVEQALEAVSQL
jgi:UDP-galactopyranose mutase